MTSTSEPASPIDAMGAPPEERLDEQADFDAWTAQAHAPGDPAPPQHSHDEVGTD